MPSDDTLTADVAELRRLRAAVSQQPWTCEIRCDPTPDDGFDYWYAIGPVHKAFPLRPAMDVGMRSAQLDAAYMTIAANLAPRLADEVDRLRAEAEALARFKKWVHDYLDAKGIPHHPSGIHGAEGCRIGDRMDYLFAEVDRLRQENERLREIIDRAY